MALLVPDASEVTLLSYLVNKASPTNAVLKLYSSNTTPAEATVIGDFTEASATGYAAITLTGASWTVGTSTGTTSATYAEQSFTVTSGLTCYGYYVTSTGGSLLWAERFSGAPYTLPSGGGVISVTPSIELA